MSRSGQKGISGSWFGALRLTAAALMALGALAACQQQEPSDNAGKAGPAASGSAAVRDSRPRPPSPPIFEGFEGEPGLSLFPRIGTYRPENNDEIGLPFWNAYVEHVKRTSGVVSLPVPLGQGGRAFSFRGVAGLDSLGFFSPLAVEPDTTYRIKATFKVDLPDEGTAGIGILEFDEFLWMAEQYPESLTRQHLTGTHPGLRLSGRLDWESRAFTFTTGPRTAMIHLVFFREGRPDRGAVIFDEVSVEKAE